MGKLSKQRKVCGIVAHRDSGKIWTWTVRHRSYRWCPLGNVEEIMPDLSCVRVAHVRSVDGAVAYTVGYADGQSSIMVQMLDSPGYRHDNRHEVK